MKLWHVAAITALVIILSLVGCAAPCTYKGKAVPAYDAAQMRKLGMDVVCP